jgi:hypothetical protein
VKTWSFSDGTRLEWAGADSVSVQGDSQFSRELRVDLAIMRDSWIWCGPWGSEPWSGADYQVDTVARNAARCRGVTLEDAPDVTYPDPPPVDPGDGPDTIY